MQLGGKPQSVRLKVDLTKYDNRCTVGSTGKTIPDYKVGMWGSYDHFVAVKFDNGAILDIAYDGLEML
jgi:hypothetical protein